MKILSERRRRILRAVLESLRPKGSPIDAKVDTDGLLSVFEDYFRHMDPTLQRAFPLMLDLFEYSTFILAGRSRPFSRLSPREQEAYLRDWHESPSSLRRDFLKAIKALFCLSYYADAGVLKAIGYEHQAYAEELRAARYARHARAIEAQEAGLSRPPEPLVATNAGRS
jgi:hypothetical protein